MSTPTEDDARVLLFLAPARARPELAGRTRGIYAEDYTAGGHAVIVAIDSRGDSQIRLAVPDAVDRDELTSRLMGLLDLLDPPSSGRLFPRGRNVHARAARPDARANAGGRSPQISLASGIDAGLLSLPR